MRYCGKHPRTWGPSGRAKASMVMSTRQPEMPDAVHASQRAALWHEKAASIFVAARRQGTQVERLPVELRPSTVDDGFAIQRKVRYVLGRRIGAWKCALPPAGEIIAPPLYARLIYT